MTDSYVFYKNIFEVFSRFPTIKNKSTSETIFSLERDTLWNINIIIHSKSNYCFMFGAKNLT